MSSGSEKCGLCRGLERCSEIRKSWYHRMKTAKAQAGAFLQRLRSAGKIGLCASPESEVASAFVNLRVPDSRSTNKGPQYRPGMPERT